MEENQYDANRNRSTNDRTISEYDRTRGGLEGAAMFTKQSTVQSIEILTGKAQTFIVETARHHELGDTIFVQCMTDDGLVRMALPPKVARAIARQRETLTGMSRKRAAKLLAKDRKARGVVPFQKKAEAGA